MSEDKFDAIFNDFLLSMVNGKNANLISELRHRWIEYKNQPIIEQSKQQSVINRDWEIVSLKCNNGAVSVFDEQNKKIYKNDRDEWVSVFLNANIGWQIHSVRRLSDNEVFSIGDEIDGLSAFNVEIQSFWIDDKNEMQVGQLNGDCRLESIKKSKPILFTTQDGKPIYDENEVVYYEHDLEVYKRHAKDAVSFSNRCYHDADKCLDSFINKIPCLSLNDIKWWIEKYFDAPNGININHLKPLVQNKINQ